MSDSGSLEMTELVLPPRVLGRVRGEQAGATVIFIGGLHGNEPAGVEALGQVLRDLSSGEVEVRGELVALSGNRAALARGCRFVDVDLNRLWSSNGSADGIAELPSPGFKGAADASVDHADADDTGADDAGTDDVGTDDVGVDDTGADASGATAAGATAAGEPVEVRERRELLAALEGAAAEARGPIYVMDLHTTSGSGGGFTAIGDTLPNRAFARAIPVPLVLGLEELVDGTLLEHLDDHGFISAVFETGQHGEQAAVYRAEAGIWLALAHAGLVDPRNTPRVRAAYQYLRRETRELPDVVEMRLRHAVRSGDGFRMREGYRNFQRVFEGEPLADTTAGPILATSDARILMPLYQEQGDDGFFVVREFHTFWLGVASTMRRLRLGHLLPILPGVRFHEGKRHVVEIDRRVARFYALQFFHLLGYRKQREENGRLFMIRRPFDVGD